MSQTLRVVPLTVVLLAALAACGPSNDADPTSREALAKAPPFQFGTTCTKVESSSYGTAQSRTETPRCFDGYDCGKFAPSEGIGIGGGATYHSYSYHKDIQWFEGTCKNPKPVTCNERPVRSACEGCQYTSCCVSVALCQDDPNCLAIADCVAVCKNDVACATRCQKNGERTASEHFSAFLKCTSQACADACDAVMP
jgi:hypothetical protein